MISFPLKIIANFSWITKLSWHFDFCLWKCTRFFPNSCQVKYRCLITKQHSAHSLVSCWKRQQNLYPINWREIFLQPFQSFLNERVWLLGDFFKNNKRTITLIDWAINFLSKNHFIEITIFLPKQRMVFS